ncbi:MAG TPA: hypothetical protein VHW72_06790, partial [Candidatus Angelobacter sp.]|nr:hypothetical protein [Candidatus Angelobacter sp.]
TVTLPDRGSRDSSFLNRDTEELQASLGAMEDAFQGIDLDESLRSLDDELVSLNDNMALLDMARHGQELLNSPAIEKAMREAEKALQGLKIDSDPI